VTVHLQALKELDDDPALRARVARHMAPVYALHAAVLLRLAPGQTLSSVGTRVQQTSVGAMVAARVRDALDADVCLINGGGIRAGATYTEVFTYGDLETELPFANEVVAVTMPGDVLQDVLRASRSKAPRAAPGFLQADDGVRVTDDNTLVTVAGAPFDPARMYTVATVRVLFDGMDGIAPLVAYAHAHPERIPPRDTGRELKMLVVDAFARALWAELGPFDSLDLDGDDRVTAADLRERHRGRHPRPGPTAARGGPPARLRRRRRRGHLPRRSHRGRPRGVRRCATAPAGLPRRTPPRRGCRGSPCGRRRSRPPAAG
jgi:hypothetical protein